MSKLQNTEKINVYVPEGIGASLKRDAELFEIFRANRTEVNLNRFMSMLIVGYYNGYKKERNDQVNTLKEIITPYLKDRKKQDDVAAEIMENVIITNVPKRKGKNPVKLPLKPTLDTDQMITEIKNSLGPNDYLSQYLCRMFMSYSEKPVYDRERIIFLENVAFLEEACREHREIAFATTINPGVIHHVIPYELVYGPDENFNYLICQEYNEKSEKNEAKTFKLCRINRPGYYHTSGSLEKEIIRHLEQMKRTAPQFAINEDTESCIEFTERGQFSYTQIYNGRPKADRIEEVGDNTGEKRWRYYFSCSQDQLFRYLLRFDIGEARILYPDELRLKLLSYYQKAVKFCRS